MGRLFDAVSALLDVCREPTYEGQAAVELEMIADPGADQPYPFELIAEDGRTVIDTRPIIRALVDAREREAAATAAGRFHATVAAIITAVVQRLREQTGITHVVLSGGVFQNALLLEQVLAALPAAGVTVHLHRQVPPNDGGIALGQAAVAAARSRR
jgi:hydrogenase maturation protein HypF